MTTIVYPSGQPFHPRLDDIPEETPVPAVDTSIFEFNELDSPFSNATESYVIDDFTIFNPYIHNHNNFRVFTANLLNVAANRFNLYATSFRRWI
jgi:hypothetical protein